METLKFNEKLICKYKNFYSESKLIDKFATLAKVAGLKVVYAALLLFYVMKSQDTPIKEKGLILGALGYLLLPTDLIPDSIPLFGFTDDLSALVFVIKKVSAYITPEIEEDVKAKLRDWFDTIDEETLSEVFTRRI